MAHVHTAAAGGRRQDWPTPPALFRELDAEFGFTLDAAATPENALCGSFLTEEDDALSRAWTGVVWCNPPYKHCDAFVRHAAKQADAGATVVMLVPVRADTGWWHDVALRRAEVRWMRGRVRFVDARTTAPFATAILVFRPAVTPRDVPTVAWNRTGERPALRYHGGKWMLAPWILEHLPPHRVYVEPYGGAASVLLRKARSYAEVYNDLDGEIVNLFRVIRERPAELTRALLWTPFSRTEYRVTSFEPSDDPLEAARRTVVRSFQGFASSSLQRDVKSGFRSNSNRSGTTPAHDWANYPGTIRGLARRMRGVTIENLEATVVMRQHDSPQTLHYCDPPYVHGTRTTVPNGQDGYAHEMTDDDHRSMAEVLRSLRGMVVLSGYPSDLYDRELFPDWHREQRLALADGAKERTEVIWMNAPAWRALQAARLPLFGNLSP